MYDNLRTHVEELFSDSPKTRKTNELKEEILANLIDRYNDFLENGKSEIDAFNNAVSGIGDVEELIKALNETNAFDYEKIQKQRERHAFMISVSVALYILSVVVVILLHRINNDLAASVMLTIDAFATGLIIYSFMSRPKYIKSDDTIVEDFKEWNHQNSDKKLLHKSIMSIYWPLIISIYLLTGFIFGIWDYSWIVFIIGWAILNIIKLIFQLKEN